MSAKSREFVICPLCKAKHEVIDGVVLVVDYRAKYEYLRAQVLSWIADEGENDT